MTRSGAVALAAAFAVACAISRSAAAINAAGVDTPARRILVMPFDNVNGDAKVFWLREAASVLLTDDLRALGAAPIEREERIEAFERLQVPAVAGLTDATVIRLGQLVGAAEVVVGSLQLQDNVLTVRARSIVLEPGRVKVDVTEHGPIAELFSTFERVSRRIAPSSTRTSAEIEAQHPPLPVFEDYVKGLLAETPDTAITYLNAAISAQPTFDRARLALWKAFTEQGEHERALQAVAAVPASSPLVRRARFMAALSQLDLKKYDDATATFKDLAAGTPSAAVLNDLGVVQLRRGGTGAAQAASYFNQARQADPDDPDYFFNLGYAYWQDRDVQAAIYWLREAVRRNTTDGEAHFVLGAALVAGGNPAEASREKELARRLSSTFEKWDKRPQAEQVPKGLERLKHDIELPRVRHVEASLAAHEQRDQQQLARFYLDRGRRLFESENDQEALAELDRALFSSPYLAEAHLLIGRIHLRDGRVREAIDALKISLWSAETAAAHAALANAYLAAKDPAAARAEAERAVALDPASAEARHVLDGAK